MRLFLRFFFSPSPPAADALAADLDAVFLAEEGSVDLAGALPAVEAGAFPAVEAGLGAIARLKEAELANRLNSKSYCESELTI